jgi:hypothetical protein
VNLPVLGWHDAPFTPGGGHSGRIRSQPCSSFDTRGVVWTGAGGDERPSFVMDTLSPDYTLREIHPAAMCVCVCMCVHGWVLRGRA